MIFLNCIALITFVTNYFFCHQLKLFLLVDLKLDMMYLSLNQNLSFLPIILLI
jgi:hypothetical protein